MTLLINEHQKPNENAKLCYIFVKKKKIEDKHAKDKK